MLAALVYNEQAYPDEILKQVCGWREFAGEFSVDLSSSGGVDEWFRRCLTRKG
jgi:hypothetical protein